MIEKMEKRKSEIERMSRRDFIERSAGIAFGFGLGCAVPKFKWIGEALAAFPVSGG